MARKGGAPENLMPFHKGESGNPKGRPKMPNLRDAIAKILNEEKDGKTALDAILAALRAKATKGDIRAAQELLDRGFGKSKQLIDVTADGEKITTSITFKKFNEQQP